MVYDNSPNTCNDIAIILFMIEFLPQCKRKCIRLHMSFSKIAEI